MGLAGWACGWRKSVGAADTPASGAADANKALARIGPQKALAYVARMTHEYISA